MRRTICGLSRLDRWGSFWTLSQLAFKTLAKRTTRPSLVYRDVIPSLLSDSRSTTSLAINAVDTYRSHQESDEDYLARGSQYGINSIKHLNHESNLLATSSVGTCLVDQIPYRLDLNLWKILLDYQVQHHGKTGAKSIWYGLRYRGQCLDLSSEDTLTTAIWQKILSTAAGGDDLRFLQRLCEPNGIAWRRPNLFPEVIGTLLRHSSEEQAARMCRRLVSQGHHSVFDVLGVFEVYQPQGSDELKRFCSIYSMLQYKGMYDDVMQQLWEKGRAEDAFLLHKVLIAKHDLPSSFESVKPFMTYLASKSEDHAPFLRQLTAAGVFFSGQARYAYETEQQRSHSGVSMAVKIKTNKVSDNFAAKAFATNAFPFDFVLNSLVAFGLTQIGPQSIRELGLASIDLDTFMQRITKLDDLGVDTGSSAYSRFVRKLCFAGEHALLQQALQTDMHHDVFEDRHLQQRLLSKQFHNCDWERVNLLLAMLNHGNVKALKAQVKSELMGIASSNHRTLLQLIPNITLSQEGVDNEALDHVVDRLISGLRAGQLHGQSRLRRSAVASVTAGIMQDGVAAGAHFSIQQWRMVLARLGQAGALNEVIVLSQWILRCTFQQAGKGIGPIDSPVRYVKYLNQLFDYKFQGAFMQWTLKKSLSAEADTGYQTWRRNLMLLRHFEQQYQIKISLPTLRKVVVMRGRYMLRNRRFADETLMERRSRDPRLLCTKLLETVHELWSCPPYFRRKDLATALVSMGTQKLRKTRPVKLRRQRGQLEQTKWLAPSPKEPRRQDSEHEHDEDIEEQYQNY